MGLCGELDLLGRLFLFRGLTRAGSCRRYCPKRRVTGRSIPEGRIIYRPHEYERSMGVLLSGLCGGDKGGGAAHDRQRPRPGRGLWGTALFNELEEYTTTLTAREAPGSCSFPRSRCPS